MDDPFAQFDDWAKSPKQDDPFAQFDKWAGEKPKDPKMVDQEGRYLQATQFMDKERGGEKEFGFGLGLRLRSSDMQMPLQSVGNWIARGLGGVENPHVAKKKAEEAYAKGDNSITDNQLALLASYEYEDERSKSLGVSGRIGKGIANALPVASEALAGQGLLRGAGNLVRGGSVAGPGWQVTAAAAPKAAEAAAKGSALGRFGLASAKSAGIQAAATPLTPGMWFEQSQQRAAENGGNWSDPKNVLAPLLNAAAQNAIIGHLGEATKGLGKVAPEGAALIRRGLAGAANVGMRGTAGGVLMPIEQAGADAVTTLAEKMWKKAGLDEKWTTDTDWGYVKRLADPKTRDEGIAELAMLSMMGSITSAFRGKDADPVKHLPKAIESLEKAGVPKDQQAAVLKESLSQDPEAIENKEVREFTESLQPEKAAESPKTPNAEATPEPAKPAAEEPIATETKPQEAANTIKDAVGVALGNRMVDRGGGVYRVEHGDRYLDVTTNGPNRAIIDFHFIDPDVDATTLDPAKLGLSKGTKDLFSDMKAIVQELRKAGKEIEYDASTVKGLGKRTSRSDLYTKFLEANGYEQVQKQSGSKPNVWKPQEPAKPVEEGPVNSIKNAATEAERARTGLPERVVPESDGQFFQELQGEMTRIGQEDPRRHVRLTDELIAKPRAVDKIEDALILRRQIELKNEHKQAQVRLEEARKSGDPARVVEAEQAEADSLSRYEQALSVSEATGTIWSHAGNARKMMLRDDLSLTNQLIQRRKRLGRDLNEKERAEVESLSKRLDDIESRLEKAQKADAERPTVSKGAIGKRTKGAQVEVDAAWEGLRKATKGKLFSVEAAAVEAVTATARLAKAYIKLGVAKFADFVEAVRKKSGKPLTPEAEALLRKGFDQAEAELAAEKRDKRIEAGTEKLKAKAGAGDVAKPEKKEPPRSKETSRIEAERRKVLADIKKMRVADERAKESRLDTAIRVGGDALDFQRAGFLGFDLPPALRQAGFVTMGHPVESGKALAATAKALKSEMGAHEVVAEIASRDFAKDGSYKRWADLDPTSHGADEFIQSTWIRDLPFFKPLKYINTKLTKKIAETRGLPVAKQMQRWNDAYLLRIRADRIDGLAATITPDGRPTEAQGHLIGNAVNIFTGRGHLRQMGESLSLLQKLLLAPRWVFSRFQLLAGQPIWHGPIKYGLQPRARLMIAKEYIRSVLGAGSLYGLAAIPIAAGVQGISINTDDSNSADFGEIKIGETRLNPLAGLLPVARFVSRLLSGKTTSIGGTERPQSIGETLIGEARKKLAPGPGTIWTAAELAHEKYADGKGPPLPYPQSGKDLMKSLVTPLSLKEGAAAIKDLGVGGALAWLFGSLGGGLRVHDEK